VIAAFATWQATRGFSTATIRRRNLSLGTFAAYVAPLDITNATGELAEEWLSGFTAPRTRHAYRSDLRSFFAWARKRGLVAADPMTDVEPIRVPRSLPRPVPVAMLPAIIDTARQPLRTGLALAGFAGLRRAECCALVTGDVDLEAAMLTVRNGKGGKDRSVPIHPALAELLGDQPMPSGCRLVPLVPSKLGAAASTHLRALGLPYTLHNLRATFATELARIANGNLLLVAEALGHESIQTTQGYVRLAGSEALRDAVLAMRLGAA
jgi:integrase/recombinase XerC